MSNKAFHFYSVQKCGIWEEFGFVRELKLTVTDERSGNVKLLCQDPGDQSSIHSPAV